MTGTDENEKKKISQEYLGKIENYGLEKIFRIVDEKTFVARYEFEARYRDLYTTEDGRLSVVWKFDPAPGGYGEEFVFIEGMTELAEVENSDAMSEEELIEHLTKTVKRI